MLSTVDGVSWDSRTERINHAAPQLLWEQVADDIAADIASGALPPNSRLPNETELATIYGVARVTVRSAIAHLVARDVLVVVRGRGTFVR